MKETARKIEEILEVADKCLTEWECKFISGISIVMHSDKAWTPSKRQEVVIEQLYEKACRSPY